MSANMGGDGDNGRLVNAVVQDIEALEYRLWTEGQLLDRLGIAGVRFNDYGEVKRALKSAGVRMRKHKTRAGIYLGLERKKPTDSI